MRQWLRLSLLGMYVCASAYAQTNALTLEQAWQLAEKTNPALRKAEAGLLAALGEAADGRAPLFNNPQLSVETGRRRIQDGGQSGSANDWAVGLSQTIEIAGQRGARRDAAEHALAATRQEVEEVRRQLRAEVERRFIEVLALQVREEIEQRSVVLIEGTANVVRKRVAAGEDSKLDGNLAVVEAERARSQLGELQEQLVQSRAALASVLQWSEAELPRVQGTLDPRGTSYALPDLLKAMQARPAVRALELREQSAQRRLDLERAARYPDVTLGITQSKEGGLAGQDKLTTLGVSLPLPLFRRNAAGVGRAMTELTQASIDRSATLRNTRTDLLALWDRIDKLGMRVARLQDTVVPRLEENLRLSQTSLQAGAIGVAAWILAQRQVLEGQRDLVQARANLRLLQAELEATAGWPPSKR
ncbi:MAG: TolC family protein [Burkholderiales bacterium]